MKLINPARLKQIIQEELQIILQEAPPPEEGAALSQQRTQGRTRKQRAKSREAGHAYALKKYTPEQKQQILADPNANKGAFINLLRQNDPDALKTSENPKYKNLRRGVEYRRNVTGTGLEKEYKQSPEEINNILNHPTQKNPKTGKEEMTPGFKSLLKQGHKGAAKHKIMKNPNIARGARGITYAQTRGDAERERQAKVQSLVDPKTGELPSTDAVEPEEAPISPEDLDKSEHGRMQDRDTETATLQTKLDTEKKAYNAAIARGEDPLGKVAGHSSTFAPAAKPKARVRTRTIPKPKATPQQQADIAAINQAEAEAAYASTGTEQPGMISKGYEQQAGLPESIEKSYLNQIIQEELIKMLNEEIQKEELPVIYRIDSFIDWLNGKEAELVGDREIRWGHATRPLRSAWQMFKKEKWNL